MYDKRSKTTWENELRSESIHSEETVRIRFHRTFTDSLYFSFFAWCGTYDLEDQGRTDTEPEAIK